MKARGSTDTAARAASTSDALASLSRGPLGPRLGALRAIVRPGIPFPLSVLVGRRRTLAVTLGRRIWISESLLSRPETLERIVRHELEHVRQMKSEGMVAFLYEYLREYLIHRANGLEPAEAYREIRYEREAREAETRPSSA